MASTETEMSERGRPSLTVTSGVLGLSAIVTRLATLVVMALLARGAGTGAVGYFGLASLVASFIAAALSVGLPTYLTRNASTGLVSAPEVARIHCGRLAIFVVAVVVAYPAGNAVLPEAIRLGFFLVFIASILEQWNETAWVLVRGRRNAWIEPLTNASVGLGLVGMCAVDTWLFDGMSFSDAAGYVVAASMVRSTAAFLLVGMARHLRTPARADLLQHVREALPFFASDLLGLVYFRGDVLLLTLFVSAGAVGEYVSATALVSPAVQVAASMGVGALAYAAPRFLSGKPSPDDPLDIFAFFRLAGQAAAGLIGICLPVAVLVLFGSGDNGSEAILGLAVVLTLFLVLRFANFGLSAILLAQGRAYGRLAVLVLSIGGNAVLNLSLDGNFGAFGAAWATVLTELIVAGSLLWFLKIPALIRPVLAVIGNAASAAVVLGLAWSVGSATIVAMAVGVYVLATAGWSFLSLRRFTLRTKAFGAKRHDMEEETWLGEPCDQGNRVIRGSE